MSHAIFPGKGGRHCSGLIQFSSDGDILACAVAFLLCFPVTSYLSLSCLVYDVRERKQTSNGECRVSHLSANAQEQLPYSYARPQPDATACSRTVITLCALCTCPRRMSAPCSPRHPTKGLSRKPSLVCPVQDNRQRRTGSNPK